MSDKEMKTMAKARCLGCGKIKECYNTCPTAPAQDSGMNYYYCPECYEKSFNKNIEKEGIEIQNNKILFYLLLIISIIEFFIILTLL